VAHVDIAKLHCRKTLQTIAFLAFLREKGSYGPFLIVAPLSTLTNWVSEIERFTPSIPALLYHGTPEERAEMRERVLFKKISEKFPLVVTSYNIIMNDRNLLGKLQWKYIIIDEGHRIKNMNCKLIKELKSYNSANRLLLTGTPLQNNLAELWSLLNFLLPDIFHDLELFQSWFDFSALQRENGPQEIIDEENRTNIVSNLHAILKPFLLRRLKSDGR
jgi:ATP-dependent DNA helicase